jgi:hypothetical protein
LPLERLLAILLAAAADVTIDPTALFPRLCHNAIFCPPLQLRRLCCCPSCIDVPIFVLVSITILPAAAVCVVPLMLLPMPPPPLIALHAAAMRLPLLIPCCRDAVAAADAAESSDESTSESSVASIYQPPSFADRTATRAAAADVTIDPTALSPASGLVACCCLLLLLATPLPSRHHDSVLMKA